jgi:hypothetical protein
MPTFTATVETEDADEIRAERARTDDDIRSEYSVDLTDEQVRRDRVLAAHHHGRSEADALKSALSRVVHQAWMASATTVPHSTDPDRQTPANPLNLDGAVVTIEMNDLVATATLVLPDTDEG